MWIFSSQRTKKKKKKLKTKKNKNKKYEDKFAYKPSGPSACKGHPGFLSMKPLGVFLLPPPWMGCYFVIHSVHSRATLSRKFANSHLFAWVERGTMRVTKSALAKNTMQCPGQCLTWTTRSSVQVTNGYATSHAQKNKCNKFGLFACFLQ